MVTKKVLYHQSDSAESEELRRSSIVLLKMTDVLSVRRQKKV